MASRRSILQATTHCSVDTLQFIYLSFLFFHRFLKDEASNSEKFSYVPFGAGKVIVLHVLSINATKCRSYNHKYVI